MACTRLRYKIAVPLAFSLARFATQSTSATVLDKSIAHRSRPKGSGHHLVDLVSAMDIGNLPPLLQQELNELFIGARDYRLTRTMWSAYYRPILPRTTLIAECIRSRERGPTRL